jgi:hypothetical protein
MQWDVIVCWTPYCLLVPVKEMGGKHTVSVAFQLTGAVHPLVQDMLTAYFAQSPTGSGAIGHILLRLWLINPPLKVLSNNKPGSVFIHLINFVESLKTAIIRSKQF